MKKVWILIASTLIAGICSIIYELLISTTSSYFLGDSVKHFSITIGLYMMAMGIGSFLSRYLQKSLLSKFIAMELALGCLGGMCVPLLYLAYAYTDGYYPCMIALILAIGILIGLEIPLLTRLMGSYYKLRLNISNILSVDYFGALLATLLFPFLLLPLFGIFRSSLIFGLVNMGIGILTLWAFADELGQSRKRIYWIATLGVGGFLLTVLIFSQVLLKAWNTGIFDDRVIFTKQTPYQQLVLTKNKHDLRLYIDGNLQFSALDEYRYHESLVHIPMKAAARRQKILILGGGDGLVARELFKYEEVKQVTLVDLDPEMVRMASTHPLLLRLNQNSLSDMRLTSVHRDAFVFLEETSEIYDVIVADLPDPNNLSLSRLYSQAFYKLVKRHLAKGGVFVTQATSPFFARKAFWSIVATMKDSGFKYVDPYHVYIPSFGEWGFVMGSNTGGVGREHLDTIPISVPTRFLSDSVIPHLFFFEKDMDAEPVGISTLDHPQVHHYYMEGWKKWN